MNALELRGNTGLQDKIQADAMKEVERLLADVGVLVRGVSMRWAFNEEEKAAIPKRQKAREQDMLEQEFQILNRGMEREAESTIVRLKADFNIETAKVTTEDDLKRLILGNELKFIDARETGVRIQQMKALEHELALNRAQRVDGLNIQLEAEDHALAIATKKEEQRKQGARPGNRRAASTASTLRDLGGKRRDVEMSIVERERQHDVRVTEIRAEPPRRRALGRGCRHAAAARADEARAAAEPGDRREGARRADSGDARPAGRRDRRRSARRLDLNIKGGDADHRRAMEDKKLSTEAETREDAHPDERVAGTDPRDQRRPLARRCERARRTGQGEGGRGRRPHGADARDGAAGEGRGRRQRGAGAPLLRAGHAGQRRRRAGRGTRPSAPALCSAAGSATVIGDAQIVECPACHRQIPVTDRHCRYCGRAMRQ